MNDIINLSNLSRLAYKGSVENESKNGFDPIKHNWDKFLLRLYILMENQV